VLPLTGVRSFVDLEVLAACEHFAAARERTLERSFAGVNAHVVDELVLGLERAAAAATAQPAARVVRLLRTTHVFDGEVDDRLLDAAKGPSARSTRAGRRLTLDDGR